jgi:hypothetical protein
MMEDRVCMSDVSPLLVIKSVKLAWSILDQSGDLFDAGETSRFLLETIEEMVLHNERRSLVLAYAAVLAYRRRKEIQCQPINALTPVTWG